MKTHKDDNLAELDLGVSPDQILNSRAEALAVAEDENKTDSHTPYLLFETGETRYAVLADVVSAVVSVSDLTPMLGAPDIADVVFSKRGSIYSGIRLDRAVGNPGKNQQSKAIILNDTDLTILCERFLGIKEIIDDEVITQASDNDYFCGILPERIMLIDTAKLVAAVAAMFG